MGKFTAKLMPVEYNNTLITEEAVAGLVGQKTRNEFTVLEAYIEDGWVTVTLEGEGTPDLPTHLYSPRIH